VIVIKDGEKVADGDPQTLSNRSGNRIVLKTLNDAEKIIRNIEGITSLSSDGTSYIIEANKDIRTELFYKLAENKCPIMGLEYNDLENTFLSIIEEVKK